MKLRKLVAGGLCLAMIFSLTACGSSKSEKKESETKKALAETVKPDIATELNVIDDNMRNYYEIFVYSYCDSNGDGIGDIQGLISKLDYLNDGDDTTDTDLGINGIWLMPVNPSPTYHKYDVMDYYDIDKTYGTVDDFKQLISECNKRGIKLIMDLVMNHTSDHNKWFLSACDYLKTLGPDDIPDPTACPYVDYYKFSRTKESGTYYQVNGTDWYYYAQFSSNMPDLNWDNPSVKTEFEKISKYWLDMGVGGFRLDAVKEYYSSNTKANVEVLKWFSSYVKGIKPDAYIVGEAWCGDYYEYFTSGIDSAFDFGYASFDGYLANIVQDNISDYNGQYLADNLIYSLKTIKSKNPNGIMAPFFANHDLNRAAHYLGFDKKKIKMDVGLLSLLNGSTFYYYGDEIGLGGAGDDENKRSPMIWTSNKDDKSITRGPVNMQKQYVINKFKSVEEQQKDDKSIWTYVRDAIKLRNIFPEIARGDAEDIEDVKDDDIFAVKKTYNGSSIIILANTSSKESKNVKLSRDKFKYTNIKGMLAVTNDKPYQSDDTIVLPPFSIVILK